jgi:hypothetical protein
MGAAPQESTDGAQDSVRCTRRFGIQPAECEENSGSSDRSRGRARLRAGFAGASQFSLTSVSDDGWPRRPLAAVDFDTVLTSDRNLSYQQNLSAFEIAVIVLVATSNRIDDLRPLVPLALEVFGTARGWLCHSRAG